jgi:glycine/D-amino acid oxidase-like deaminating enzyme
MATDLDPVWQRSPLGTYRPRLASDLHVDVVVVGGGVTGVTTALLLAEAGKRVCLLEARRFGAGVTGASTAHVTEAIDTRYHELRSRFGQDGARLVRASSRDAIEKIAQLSHGMDCVFERVNGYLYTELQPQMSELDAELLAAKQAGASVEACQVPLDVPSFGGICFADQAQIDPVAYVSALASRLERTGAHIHEGVSMLDVETESGVRVITDAGPVVHIRITMCAAPSSASSTTASSAGQITARVSCPKADPPRPFRSSRPTQHSSAFARRPGGPRRWSSRPMACRSSVGPTQTNRST